MIPVVRQWQYEIHSGGQILPPSGLSESAIGASFDAGIPIIRQWQYEGDCHVPVVLRGSAGVVHPSDGGGVPIIRHWQYPVAADFVDILTYTGTGLASVQDPGGGIPVIRQWQYPSETDFVDVAPDPPVEDTLLDAPAGVIAMSGPEHDIAPQIFPEPGNLGMSGLEPNFPPVLEAPAGSMQFTLLDDGSTTGALRLWKPKDILLSTVWTKRF